MSTKHDDGGAAFPRGEVTGPPGASGWIPPHDGMSLRAYMATAAMQGLLAWGGFDRFDTFHELAEVASGYADALMSEFAKEGGGDAHA